MTEAQLWVQGRVALVTGATAGIGEACVRRLVAGGAKVIAVGRRTERLEALRSELGADSVLVRTADLTSSQAPQTILADLPPAFSSVDLLINNAGLALGTGPAQTANLDDWETMIATNVTGLVRLTRALLPTLIEQPRADVINVSSVAASYPYPGGNVYGGTKAFVRQFSLGLRSDLLGTHVRVTSVEPGLCETEFSVIRYKGDATAAANVYAGMTPLSGDDVAQTIESVLRLPPHININTIEMMPIEQAFNGFAVHRR